MQALTTTNLKNAVKSKASSRPLTKNPPARSYNKPGASKTLEKLSTFVSKSVATNSKTDLNAGAKQKNAADVYSNIGDTSDEDMDLEWKAFKERQKQRDLKRNIAGAKHI